MKRYLILLTFPLMASMVTAQNVTNVESSQQGKKIMITYTLDKVADISVYCSTDGGKTFGSALKQVTGDVGKNVAAGNNIIVWDVLAEVDKLQGDNIFFKVKASSFGDIEMVFVQGGTFTMGCTSEQGADCYDREMPSHEVMIRDFYIGKYEVTQKQWTAVMGSNPSYFKGDDLPVERVSWEEVQEFIRKLNAQTGKTYRLPTEAEWEYAARGGNQSKGYKYSGSNVINNVAWYDENSGSETHLVGSKFSNELGLYDMSGNVWEWCSDFYGPYSSYTQSNPTGVATGSRRVYRGGSWDDGVYGGRVSYRNYNFLSYRRSYIGFRLVSF